VPILFPLRTLFAASLRRSCQPKTARPERLTAGVYP
jgi:hypothetical protein